MNKKILIPVGIVLVIALLVVGIVCFINRPTGLEAEAVKYVKQLEDIVGDVEVIDAVAFSYIPYGEEEIEYKFLIVYNGRNGEDFATFLSDPELGYIGNGYNGGSSNDDMQQTINNVNALSAQKTYLEYLIGEVDAIDREDAENNKEKGLIQLDVEKIK